MLISSFDDRIHEHRREARVPSRLRIERRDANEAMHAGFGAAGIRRRTCPLISSTAPLMPASSPSLTSSISIVEPVPLGPARVHAHEHLRPVLRFGAAGAGADLELRVAEIIGTAQERSHLERVDFVVNARRFGVELLDPSRARSRPAGARRARWRCRARPVSLS